MVTVNEVFRDFETDGVPASGPHKPKKADIRALLSAIVTGGSDGLYDFVPASDTGSGTPNAIKATTAVDLPATPLGALIAFNIYRDNDASPVTVQFNNGAIYTIKTSTGFDPDPGALRAGMIAAGYISGSTFRLLTDNVASALLSAMQALRDEASASQTAAAASETSAAASALSAGNDASTAQTAASDAQTLVTQATAGFTGFPDGNAYDFGYVADATTYFDQDWGSIAA